MKKGGCHLKKFGDDVITQKPITSSKQVVRHRMAFFQNKIDLSERFSKKSSHNATMNFVPNFMFTVSIECVITYNVITEKCCDE
jgi:hypothetical protein